MFRGDGEIDKALFGYGNGTSQIVRALIQLAKVMPRDEMVNSLDDLVAFDQKLRSYGHSPDELSDLVTEVELEVEESEDSEDEM
jgi:hypothetical protein